jgi:prolipoprotein diacylglyceryl transferase
LAIWEGGLGIWGAIALGGVGAWIACRRRGIPLPVFADALAPGLLVAQAIGRLGNWFNNELYGRATDLPWALTIYDWTGTGAVVGPDGQPVVLGTFHPTFLYELLWNLAAAAVVIWADRRFRLGHGRAFALYVALYCAGRLWIELLRTDPAETFAGIRLNVFTAVVVGLLAVAYLVWQRGRPREVVTRGRDTGDTAPAHRTRAESAPAATPGPAPAAAETRDGEDAGGDGGRRHTDA